MLHPFAAALPTEITRRAALGRGFASAASVMLPATATPGPAVAAAAPAVVAPSIALPGGGNYFWWQAGAAAWLESRFDLKKAQFVGGSAGAMSATMAACDVDFRAAFELEERIIAGSSEDDLHREPPYWGGHIRNWLDGCLPADACKRCNGRVHISVTELTPSFGTTTVSTYSDRDDLIDAVLASVHVPFWMDNRFCTSFRGTQCIDGSVYLPRLSEPALLSRPPYMLPDGTSPDVRIFQFDDPRMVDSYPSPTDFLATKSPAQKTEMMQWGASHVAQLDADGELRQLEGLRKERPTEIRMV